MSSQRMSIKHVVITVIFTVASAGFGLIKLPGPVGSIALDSLPAFFSAAYFSPLVGGFVGGLGHLASAATSGFPLGPAHLFIALTMFCWCFLFGYLIRRIDRPWAIVVAGVLAVALNAVLSPLLLAAIFPQFRGLLSGLIVFLLVGASANVLLASVVFKVLSKLDLPGM
mgnify:CR=1 FL=1